MIYQKLKKLAVLFGWTISCLLTTVGCISAQQHAYQAHPSSTNGVLAHPATMDLDPVRHIMKNAVNTNRVEGVSLLLQYDGEIILKEAYGNLRVDQPVRIASSSKPVAAAAVMILVDEGRLSLTDSISSVLPEFRGTPVAEATLRQLLSHTAGVMGRYPGGRPQSGTLADFSQLVAEHGNLKTPGQFSYSGVSIDIACRMAEVAAGIPFEEHIRTRLWHPLGMKNTDFDMAADPNTVSMAELRRGEGRYVSCGGGLKSTLDDMAAFYSMLLQGGSYGGRQILSRSIVEEMYRKQAINPRKMGDPYTMGEYGLGLYRDRAGVDGSALTISHGGALGTLPWADLDRNLVGVFFTQNRLRRVMPIAYEIQEQVRQIIPRSKVIGEKSRDAAPAEGVSQAIPERDNEFDRRRAGASHGPEQTFKRISGGRDSIRLEQFKHFFLEEMPNSRFQDRPRIVEWIFYRLDENQDGYLTLDEYSKIRSLRADRE